MNKRYRLRASYLFLFLIFSIPTIKPADPSAAPHILTQIIQYVSPMVIPFGAAVATKISEKMWGKKVELPPQSTNVPTELTPAATIPARKQVEASLVETGDIVIEVSTSTAEPLQVSTNAPSSAMTSSVSVQAATEISTQANKVEIAKNPSSQAKASASNGKLVICGQDAAKQFLQPGQRQPYDNPEDPNYGFNGSFYNDGKGNVGYQTSVGNSNVSVGTDIGSVVRFAKDVGEILFVDDGKPKTSSEKRAAVENVLREQLKTDAQTYQAQYAKQGAEQLASKKTQLEQQRSQVCKQSAELGNKLGEKKHSHKVRERILKDLEQIDYENRRLATEINVINSELGKRDLHKQVITVGATTAVMITQAAGTTGTTTTKPEIVPTTPQTQTITTGLVPISAIGTPSSKAIPTGVEPVLTSGILKEMVEIHKNPGEPVDMDAWNKLLYDPAYKVTPEAMATIEVTKAPSSSVPSKVTAPTNIPTLTQTPLSSPVPASQPSMLSQAKDGATFFVKNAELQGTAQVMQNTELYAEFLKDDGAADYLLGKPAKYALGSCIVAVGVPSAIGAICPPCAPFVAPAISAGFTYCTVAVPAAGGGAIAENAAHLAGYETSITQTRRKVFEKAKAALNKPEYELTDEQYFNRLSKVPTDQLEKMKSESESWIHRASHYSPSATDRYAAQNEQRFGRLIGEELEIRPLRHTSEISDEENINRFKNHSTESIKSLKQTQENFIKIGANSTSRKDKYLASRAQHYLKQTEEELEIRALHPAREISDEEHIKGLKDHSTESLKKIKQKQENLIKTGAINKSRKDQYLASRAQYYLKHTEQELQLREKTINQTTAIVPQQKQKPGCGPTEPLPPMPPLITPVPPQEKPNPGCVPPVIEAPKPLVNVPVQTDWRNYILTQGKPSDKDKVSDKSKIAEKEAEKLRQQKERAEKIRNHRRWTNKEARDHAEALGKGYEEKKNKPIGIKDIAFTNGKNWISPDIDGHNGGVWKEFNLKGDRIGTLDKNLNKIKT